MKTTNLLLITVLIALTFSICSCGSYKHARLELKEKRIEWKVIDDTLRKIRYKKQIKRKILRAKMYPGRKVHLAGKWFIASGILLVMFYGGYEITH